MTLTDERPQTEDEEGDTRPSPLDRVSPPRSRGVRRIVALLIGLVVVLSGLAVPWSMGAFPWVWAPPLPEDAALSVDGKVITVADYDRQMKTVKALLGAQPPADPPGADRFRRDSAKALALATVMRNAEADRNIVVPDTQIRATVNDMVTQQYGPGPDGYGKFVQALGQVGSSEGDVLDQVRDQLASATLVDQITQTVNVRDDELPAEFGKYAEKLGQPEQRRLSNIVVTTPEQAGDIANQVRSGIPFADLAKRLSLDTSTKDAGGDMGVVAKDQLQQPYADAAFGAAKGQPYGPVQSAQGWNVGFVADVLPGKPADYQQAQIPLKNAVTTDRKMKAWTTWLSDEIKNSRIRYADPYRPADPDGLPPGLVNTRGTG